MHLTPPLFNGCSQCHWKKGELPNTVIQYTQFILINNILGSSCLLSGGYKSNLSVLLNIVSNKWHVYNFFSFWYIRIWQFHLILTATLWIVWHLLTLHLRELKLMKTKRLDQSHNTYKKLKLNHKFSKSQWFF